MTLTRDQLRAALAAGTFEIFVGEIETDFFDAKSEPYRVDTDAGKRELAKDTSAFANAAGGYILIGLRTQPSALHHADEIELVRAVPQGVVNTTQLRDIVNDWVYPPIDGLITRFYPSAADGTKGIVAIEIPEQRLESRPFLVVKTFDGTRHVETMFGYVQRRVDANVPFGVAEIQKAIRAGLNYDREIANRLDRIEALVEAQGQRAGTATSDGGEAIQQLELRIQEALEGERGGTGA